MQLRKRIIKGISVEKLIRRTHVLHFEPRFVEVTRMIWQSVGRQRKAEENGREDKRT